MDISIMITCLEDDEKICEYLGASLEHALQDYSESSNSRKQPKINPVLIKATGHAANALSNANTQFLGLKDIDVAIFVNPQASSTLAKACKLYATANKKVRILYSDTESSFLDFLGSDRVEFIAYEDPDQLISQTIIKIEKDEINKVINRHGYSVP